MPSTLTRRSFCESCPLVKQICLDLIGQQQVAFPRISNASDALDKIQFQDDPLETQLFNRFWLSWLLMTRGFTRPFEVGIRAELVHQSRCLSSRHKHGVFQAGL